MAIRPMKTIACLSWLALHRFLMRRGFTLTGNLRSTDGAATLFIIVTGSLWLIESIIVTPSEANGLLPILAWLRHITAAPVFVVVLSLAWLVICLDTELAKHSSTHRPRLWSLEGVNGPSDWSSGLNRHFLLAIQLSLTSLVCLSALTHALCKEPVECTLDLVGLVAFLLPGRGDNPYVHAPQRYTGDNLRIILPTAHHQGTVYVLPSARRGFDAVWSPKVAAEHKVADEQIMSLFLEMRSGRWGLHRPLQCLRETLARFYEDVSLQREDVLRLASWLYESPSPTASADAVPAIACSRAPGTRLVGRDVMYALCHAEYIVFMGQTMLPPELRQRVGRLRSMQRSGVAPSTPTSQERGAIGFQAGLAGYEEAVAYVYRLFRLAVDDAAVNFSDVQAPAQSVVFGGRQFGSGAEYAGALWDVSIAHTESTFSALWMFTTVWFMEVGNVGGFNILPLRTRDFRGDVTALQIVWRQVWYSGLVAQLISASPIFFSAFVVGWM